MPKNLPSRRPHALRAASRPSGEPPLERFRAGELDRDGYIDAMIEEALGPLRGLPEHELEFVRGILRDFVETDPALMDLVDLATSTSGD
jgi:hypothetical protein